MLTSVRHGPVAPTAWIFYYVPRGLLIRVEWRACLGMRRQRHLAARRRPSPRGVACRYTWPTFTSCAVRLNADLNPAAAREYLGKATILVADTGYHRRRTPKSLR